MRRSSSAVGFSLRLSDFLLVWNVFVWRWFIVVEGGGGGEDADGKCLVVASLYKLLSFFCNTFFFCSFGGVVVAVAVVVGHLIFSFIKISLRWPIRLVAVVIFPLVFFVLGWNGGFLLLLLLTLAYCI